MGPQVSAPKAFLLGYPGLVFLTNIGSHYRAWLSPVRLPCTDQPHDSVIQWWLVPHIPHLLSERSQKTVLETFGPLSSSPPRPILCVLYTHVHI